MKRKFVCECKEFKCVLTVDIKDKNADFYVPFGKCHQPDYDALWREIKEEVEQYE